MSYKHQTIHKTNEINDLNLFVDLIAGYRRGVEIKAHAEVRSQAGDTRYDVVLIPNTLRIPRYRTDPNSPLVEDGRFSKEKTAIEFLKDSLQPALSRKDLVSRVNESTQTLIVEAH